MWGSAEVNIEAAGGFGVAEGYYTMQFAGVGQDYPVLNEIREMYKKQGKPAPKEMASSVYYNRGVFHGRGARRGHPQCAQGEAGRQDHRRGHQGGLREDQQLHPRRAGAAAQDVTPTDHEGGGLVQIWQVKGGKFEKVTDWFSAYPDVIAKHTKEAAASKGPAEEGTGGASRPPVQRDHAEPEQRGSDLRRRHPRPQGGVARGA